jgi:hypothetical protein
MYRYSLRSPAAHFTLYFVLGLIYAKRYEIERLFEKEPLSPSTFGISDPIVGPGVPGAILLATLLGLVPAIGSLAGVGLVKNSHVPKWPRIIVGTLLTLAPTLAVVGVYGLIGHLLDTKVPSAISIWPEIVLPLLGILWLLTPVVLTKYIHEKRVP